MQRSTKFGTDPCEKFLRICEIVIALGQTAMDLTNIRTIILTDGFGNSICPMGSSQGLSSSPRLVDGKRSGSKKRSVITAHPMLVPVQALMSTPILRLDELCVRRALWVQ